ncbi:MAG: hypothetical protein ACKVRN_17045 [Pyrinomonadaceae bacterium]
MISVFVLAALFIFWGGSDHFNVSVVPSSEAAARPTPTVSKSPALPTVSPSATSATGSPTIQTKPTPASSSTPAKSASTIPSPLPTSSGEKKMRINFILDNQKEYFLYNKEVGEGLVEFDHDTHSTKKYSIDGKSVIKCDACHHTNSATLTSAFWKDSEKQWIDSKKKDNYKKKDYIENCHECHNPQSRMNNEDAYHQNCNVCHDKAFEARKELKNTNPKFGVTDDCIICHIPRK